MTEIETNARTAEELAGASFGFQGGAVFLAGFVADQSWSMFNPEVRTTQFGYGVGGNAYVGAEVGWTWVLY